MTFFRKKRRLEDFERLLNLESRVEALEMREEALWRDVRRLSLKRASVPRSMLDGDP